MFAAITRIVRALKSKPGKFKIKGYDGPVT